jgi:hypothetical protein
LARMATNRKSDGEEVIGNKVIQFRLSANKGWPELSGWL